MPIDDRSVLITESDVEQKVIMPLLLDGSLLGIPQANIYTKQYLSPAALDKSAGKMSGYYPDYSIWLHGLPVMIVEAKAPGVAAEEGYREASLYARHLNQRFPAGVNPCARIVAINGHTLLCGVWDAEPDLTVAVGDIRVGTAALDALQSHCSAQVLSQVSDELSDRLRLLNVTLPYDLLGGQAVINAKRPLNTFAADLSPILRRYFSSTPQENIHEIAAKAYVSSNEVTEYDRVLESLLKDRIAFRQHAIVKELEPKKHQESNVARAIATFDQERPEQGQLQLVQGPVGAGKSLFARRYKDVLQPSEDAARTRWAFIDFNTSTMGDVPSAERWVCEKFIEAFQVENPPTWISIRAQFKEEFSLEIFKSEKLYTQNWSACRRSRRQFVARLISRLGKMIRKN